MYTLCIILVCGVCDLARKCVCVGVGGCATEPSLTLSFFPLTSYTLSHTPHIHSTHSHTLHISTVHTPVHTLIHSTYPQYTILNIAAQLLKIARKGWSYYTSELCKSEL